MGRFLGGAFKALDALLKRPQRVFWLCLGLLAANTTLDGSLVRWWALRRDAATLAEAVVGARAKTSELEGKVARARDPAFLEREARDRFDLVREGDLVFVFADE